MSSRLVRQIMVILIIVGAIGGIIYFIWSWNRPEEQPPPPPPDEPEFQEISTNDGQLIKNDYNWDYIILIENLNSNWVLKSFNYKLVIDGDLVYASKGTDYLNVLEEKPLIITRLNLDNDQVVPEIQFSNLEWVKPNTNIGNTDILINSHSMRESFIPSGKKTDLMGLVQNRTDYDLANIDLYIQVLDNQGNLIAVNKSTVGPISMSERKQFNTQWINAEINNTSTFDIIASTNFYSDSNILEAGGISRQDQ